MKKIIAILGSVFACATVIAMPSQELMTLSKFNNGDSWCLSHDIDQHQSCATAIGFHPSKPSTIILYVKQNIANSTTPSDHVFFDCNTVPIVVSAGQSYACTLPAGGLATWKVESNYLHNGADGLIFSAEGEQF